jgi:hypothetical protein
LRRSGHSWRRRCVCACVCVCVSHIAGVGSCIPHVCVMAVQAPLRRVGVWLCHGCVGAPPPPQTHTQGAALASAQERLEAQRHDLVAARLELDRRGVVCMCVCVCGGGGAGTALMHRARRCQQRAACRGSLPSCELPCCCSLLCRAHARAGSAWRLRTRGLRSRTSASLPAELPRTARRKQLLLRRLDAAATAATPRWWCWQRRPRLVRQAQQQRPAVAASAGAAAAQQRLRQAARGAGG